LDAFRKQHDTPPEEGEEEEVQALPLPYAV